MAVTLKQLLEAGCHFGHQSRRWNPKMKQYLFAERDGVHVFDLVKTKEGLERACEFVTNLVAAGGTIVFVGTKRQASPIVLEAALRVGVPYVTVRWLGGTLTNFPIIKKRIDKLSDLKTKRAAGDLKEFTKKEQLLIDREITKLERFFGGISEMTKLPEALFVIDVKREDTAVREAQRMGVKVVAVVDSNGDEGGVDVLIPANDDAVKSLSLIISQVAEAVLEGKKLQAVKVEESRQQALKEKEDVVSKVEGVVEEPEEV